MRRILEKYLHQFEIWSYRRRIEHALALNLRGEVRNDGLKLNKVRNRLEIQWRAREIHPWDRDLPPEKRLPLFVEQSLTDTEAAICRLFEALSQVDVIDLMVLEPFSENAIMAGTIYRSLLNRPRQLLSVRMRLRELGIRDHLAGYRFESMDRGYDHETLSRA